MMLEQLSSPPGVVPVVSVAVLEDQGPSLIVPPDPPQSFPAHRTILSEELRCAEEHLATLRGREAVIRTQAADLSARLLEQRRVFAEVSLSVLALAGTPDQALLKAAKQSAMKARAAFVETEVELDAVASARTVLAKHIADADAALATQRRIEGEEAANNALEKLTNIGAEIDVSIATLGVQLETFNQRLNAARAAVMHLGDQGPLLGVMQPQPLLAPAYNAIVGFADGLLAKAWGLEIPPWGARPRLSVAAGIPQLLKSTETADSAWKGGIPSGPRQAPLSSEMHGASP